MKIRELITRDVKFEDETREFFSMVRISSILLMAYFICNALVLFMSNHIRTGSACLGFCALSAGVIYCSFHVRRRVLFHIYSIFLLAWATTATICFGNVIDAELMLIPLFIARFFATYDNFRGKLFYSIVITVSYIVIYFYNYIIEPKTPLNDISRIHIKMLTIIVAFAMTFTVCWYFANTTQMAQSKLAKRNLQLSREAMTDPLTDLPNRRNMYKTLDKYTDNEWKQNVCFCVAMGDIDFFKQINDTRGHNCGDYVLQTLAKMFKEFMQDKGTVCRWGGEEFFFYFPDGNGDQVFLYVERLRLEIEKTVFSFEGEEFNCTMTFGVSEYNQKDSSDELVQNVDRKLYVGKERGRNRVIW